MRISSYVILQHRNIILSCHLYMQQRQPCRLEYPVNFRVPFPSVITPVRRIVKLNG